MSSIQKRQWNRTITLLLSTWRGNDYCLIVPSLFFFQLTEGAIIA
ncbi:hypothetical protein RGU12_08820 [Fredinandcohnia sp. QZ13]|nr:hypothetical protein [Fredinandcohnia sp. QZ13]MDR4887646.1 hypothetical protein [Fredinandcohnia sp. QZ13]